MQTFEAGCFVTRSIVVWSMRRLASPSTCLTQIPADTNWTFNASISLLLLVPSAKYFSPVDVTCMESWKIIFWCSAFPPYHLFCSASLVDVSPSHPWKTTITSVKWRCTYVSYASITSWSVPPVGRWTRCRRKPPFIMWDLLDSSSSSSSASLVQGVKECNCMSGLLSFAHR